MNIKTKRLFTKGFLSAMILLCIWACTSPEPIEEHPTNENIAQLKEIGVVKQWISNTTTNDVIIPNVYALHQWDLAKVTVINKNQPNNFTLDIPLSVGVANSNYEVFARYIQLTNELKVRVFVKSKDILKNNKVNTNFVYPIDDSQDFLKIPKLVNAKLNNYEFKNFYDTNSSIALRYSTGGCGCNSGFWSSIWNAIANFGGNIWNGIKGVSNAIGSFFSNWGGSYSNYTPGSTSGGGYGLYEFEEILAENEANGDGYEGWVVQELFYLPNTVTNGQMYHMNEYGKAVSNLDVITGQITSAYPNVNKGELLNAIFKLHLHSNYHNDIYNGNLSNVIDIVNFEDYVYDEHMWDLLQKFTHKFFYENSSGTNLLAQALDNTSNYKKRVLLTTLGFNANYVINTFSQQQLNWIANNPETGKQIAAFLNQNSTGYGYNNGVVIIILEAINNLMSFTPSNYPSMQDSLPFNWWNDDGFLDNNFVLGFDEGFGNLTEAEKLLITLFPVQALIIRANVEIAHTVTENRFGVSARNDKSDAFRHAFFNAMNSNDAGDTVARSFSTAHESEVPANLILEVQMDLHNNNVGHTIGDNASIFVSDQELSNSVYAELLAGNLFYLSPLDPVVPPNFGINSSTQLTPTNQ